MFILTIGTPLGDVSVKVFPDLLVSTLMPDAKIGWKAKRTEISTESVFFFLLEVENMCFP